VRQRNLILILFATLFFYKGEIARGQDPQFTQFYSNQLYLNPAFAGVTSCPRVITNYRAQWTGITGLFSTSSASIDSYVDYLSGGLGLMVTHDQAGRGTINSTTASGIYAYKAKVNRTFSIQVGLQGTYFQRTLNWSKLTFMDQIDSQRGFIYNTNQPRVDGDGNVKRFDLSAGILGFGKKYYFGAAFHHLTEPDESLILGYSELPMKITGHFGAMIPLKSRSKNSKKLQISPNVLYQQQGKFQQLNLGMYIMSGPLVYGFWYRNKDSFIALIGIQTDIVKFGYSFDLTVSRLTPATAGSHEISMAIQLDCVPKRRSYRAISCPSF